MRQLLRIFLFFPLAFPSLAGAFTDAQSMAAVREAKVLLRQQNSEAGRVEVIKRLKHVFNTRLNTIEIPDLDSIAENDPRIEGYRSLTEFETYLDLMPLNNLSKRCPGAAASIVAASTASEEISSPEAEQALSVLESLCSR